MLDIIKYDVYRGPNIGIYTKVNDSFVFLPNGFAKTKTENLAEYLKTDFIFTSIANTRLIGILMVVNNNGILLPNISFQHELEHLKKSTKLNVEVLDTNVEPATINGGIPFVSSGILANNKSIVVGTLTNGPEIMMLTRAFTN